MRPDPSLVAGPLSFNVISLRSKMEITQKHWAYGGAGLLFVVSSLIFVPNIMNVWVPMPLYLVLLGWYLMFLVPVLTPGLYLLNSLAAKTKYFSWTTIILITVFASLNVWYFHAAWSYGTRYQGVEHTQIVALENLVGFGLALLLSVWSLIRKSKMAAYAANLIFYILLSWCAFPYLGEMP